MNFAPATSGGVDVSMAGKLLAGERAATLEILRKSKRYLIATFPNMKQVAYLHLPDTVWRPLVIGEVQFSKALANDPQHSRLFVSDQPQNKVFWYNVHIDPE